MLWVKTPSAAVGYWKRLDHSRRTFVGDWFRTGDVYVRDADGFYTHCGREDDFFKVAGQWVVPADVEAAMLKHPGVLEAVVVGAEDASGLIKTFVFVIPRDEAADPEGLAAELRQLAESSLPAHERPREIRVVRELPRTGHREAQALPAQGRGGGPAMTGAVNRIDIKVRWSEADAAGIAFYPRFFEWFDMATEALFESLEMPWPVLFPRYRVVGVPIVDVGARFASPYATEIR